MNFLEQRILAEGVVKPGNVLKVETFMNHQVDVALADRIGREFVRRFAGKKITMAPMRDNLLFPIISPDFCFRTLYRAKALL